jgi:hypothetical protein
VRACGLVDENHRRSRKEPEFELLDTGVFDGDRYFDVVVEYAKLSPNDILIRITAANRGPEAATLHLLPTLWFRNTWSWACRHEDCTPQPKLQNAGKGAVLCDHQTLGEVHFCDRPDRGCVRAQLFVAVSAVVNQARGVRCTATLRYFPLAARSVTGPRSPEESSAGGLALLRRASHTGQPYV